MAASAGRARPAGAVDAVLGEYLEALVAGDLSGAQHVLDVALDSGTPPRRLYLEVLQPALYEVGRRWSRAELSVAQEHLATATTERAMARLAGRLDEAERALATGADAYAPDAEAAVRVLHERFAA